jgi:Flp pilus assembly protein TadG
MKQKPWIAWLNFFKRRKGTSIIEFALIAPVFLLVVLAGIDTAILIWEQYSLHYALSAGARYASLHPTSSTADIQNYALSVIPTLPDTPTFDISVGSTSATISASLSHTFLYYPFSSVTLSSHITQPLSTN